MKNQSIKSKLIFGFSVVIMLLIAVGVFGIVQIKSIQKTLDIVTDQAGPIIEHTTQKKKRGKPQQRIIISAIKIKNLELNIIQADSANLIKEHNINIAGIGGKEGMVINQLGGEILLHLLKLTNK